MKITKKQLEKIIKEELKESDWYTDQDETLADYKFRQEQDWRDSQRDPEEQRDLEKKGLELITALVKHLEMVGEDPKIVSAALDLQNAIRYRR
jgi:hypothetical protein